MPVLLVAFAILDLSVPTALGQTSSATPPSIAIPRVQAPPKLDDYASGRNPQSLVAVTDFRQREPGDGDPVSRPTKAYLGYDDKNFYVVFVCKEDAGKVRANMTKREAIMGDEVVGVVLDTFRDQRHAYLFLINPLGIQMDGYLTEGQDDDYSFDTVWHSEGRLTPDGYVALFAIPFRSLRFKDAPSQTWGLSLGRILPTRNETSFWPYITRKIAGIGEQLATMNGLERISPGRNLQFIPYGAFTGSRYLDEDASRYERENEGRGGVDAKFIVKDAVTVDVTANPDFSQVESDEPQVTINQRFEVYFPEKRPFFIENAGMFTTPENLFFSRRIVDPLVGTRVTGKAGGWVVAGLAIDDRYRGDQAAPGDPLHDKGTVIGVGRVQRDVGQKSSVGVFASTYDVGPASNRVIAADTRLQFSSNWIVSGQATYTTTTDEEGEQSSGTGYTGELSYSSRAFGWDASYMDRAPDFHTELGYVPRTDMRRAMSGVRYRWFPKNSKLLSFGPSARALWLWNYAGELQDWWIEPEFELEFPRDTRIEVDYMEARERYEGIDFRKRTTGVTFETAWLRWLSLDAGLNVGTGVNYDPADGVTPFLGDEREVEVGVTLRPSPRLRIDQAYIFNQLRTRANEPATAGLQADVYNLHLTRTKVNYQFTRALSLRAILDYSGVLPNPSLIDLERDKRLTADVLLTYLVNPWTAFYVGYTDQYANVAAPGPTVVAGRRPVSPTTAIGRQVFVKVSYLLRY